MIENLGLQLLSNFFLPFLQQERDRKEWIEHKPGLTESLNALGYDGSTRSFTPAQAERQGRAIIASGWREKK